MKQRIHITLLTLIFVCEMNVSSFGQTYFQKVYGDNSINRAFSVLSTSTGDFVIAGQTGTTPSTKDLFLMKVDSLGKVLWSRAFGGAQSEEGRICKQTPDGGYVISGYTSAMDVDAVLIKTNERGELQWAKKYGSTGNDFAWPLDITANGDIYLAGWSSSVQFGGPNDGFIIKTNQFGDTLWTRMVGTSGDDFFRAIATTTDGGCIAVGETNGFSGNFDIQITRLNANGDTAWTKVLGTAADADYAWTVRQSADGGFIIGGNSGTNAAVGDAIIIKLNSNGVVEWSKMIGDGNVALNTCRSITPTQNGGYLFSGYTGMAGGNEEGLAIMLNSIGDTVWTRQYAPGNGIEHIRSIHEIRAGEFVAVGYTASVGAGADDIFLLRMNSQGIAGRCSESATRFRVMSHTLPSVSGILSRSTRFISAAFSGTNSINYSSTTICETNILTSVLQKDMNDEFVIYPTPAKDIIYFSKPQKNISLYTLQGRLISEWHDETSSISISNLVVGVYVLKTPASAKIVMKIE